MNYKDADWLRDKYEKDRLSKLDIAKLCGVSEGTIRYYISKFNITSRNGKDKITSNSIQKMSDFRRGKPTWNSGLAGKYQKWTKKGVEAPGYKGGVCVNNTRGGYKKILSSNHPNADANGYVFEHRLVCEKLLGRYLTQDEIVHHRDKNPLNNTPENLFIFYGHDAHISFHMAQRRDMSLTEEEFCRGEDCIYG
jgi:hypothetical protein